MCVTSAGYSATNRPVFYFYFDVWLILSYYVEFLLRDGMVAWYMLWTCPSVCLSLSVCVCHKSVFY